ncbi:MAG TPA: hypothetical protein VIK60_09660 [Vicinamibacterales bacterium]
MFDAIKGLAGGKKAHKEYDDLQALVTTAQAERDALTAILKQLVGRSATLVQTGEALEQIDAKAAVATASIDALEKRIQRVEQQAAALGEIEDRVQALVAATATAQRQAEKLLAPDGALERHRRETHELSTQVAGAEATAEALMRERSTFEALHLQLQQSSAELAHVKESVHHVAAVREELEQLRDVAAQLTHEVGAIREASREADDNAFSAAEAVKEMERRLGQMEALRELSDTIEGKLTSVNALAEHVNQKVRSLDAQKHVIDRAVLETNRLNEMVWSMDGQISKLNDWLAQAEHTEERLKRLDQLAAETGAKLDVATTVGDEFRTSFQALLGQAEELAKKQASLETLQDQLAQVHDMSVRTTADIESFRQSRADLEALQKDVQDFHHAYTGAAQLSDKLAADRTALETFDDRMSSFLARTSELETATETILARMGLIEEGMRQAAQLSKAAADIHDQLAGVDERIQFVSMLEDRLNALQGLASDVDHRLASQLARQAELDTLREQWDTIAAQIVEGQQRMEAIAALQEERVVPIETRLEVMQDRLDRTGEHIETLRRDEDELARQESRLIEFADASKALADEARERMKAMYMLAEELARSGPAGDEVISEMSRVQANQREAIAQAESLEAKMAEFAQRFREIERQLRTLAERDIALSAPRHQTDEVDQISVDGDADLHAVTERHEEVVALRQEVQELMTVAAVTEEKIAADAAQSKATLTDLLEGVRVNLETVSEQKAMVDKLNGRLANVQFVIQEAQNTLRMLNQERELVERIEQSIRQMRASS